MHSLTLPFLLLSGYLLGSLSGAHIVTRFFFGKDITKLGTTNAGAGNVIRLFGIRAGIAVGIVDFIKGALPIIAGIQANLSPAALLFVGSSTIAGHNWPIFFRFRGGRGTATLFGFVAAFSWDLLLSLAFVMLPLALFPISGILPFFVLGALSYLRAPQENALFLLGSLTMLAVILIRRFQTEWDDFSRAQNKLLALFNMVVADHAKTEAKNWIEALKQVLTPKFIASTKGKRNRTRNRNKTLL